MQWYVHEKQKWFEKLLNYYLINNGYITIEALATNKIADVIGS